MAPHERSGMKYKQCDKPCRCTHKQEAVAIDRETHDHRNSRACSHPRNSMGHLGRDCTQQGNNQCTLSVNDPREGENHCCTDHWNHQQTGQYSQRARPAPEPSASTQYDCPNSTHHRDNNPPRQFHPANSECNLPAINAPFTNACSHRPPDPGLGASCCRHPQTTRKPVCISASATNPAITKQSSLHLSKDQTQKLTTAEAMVTRILGLLTDIDLHIDPFTKPLTEFRNAADSSLKTFKTTYKA